MLAPRKTSRIFLLAVLSVVVTGTALSGLFVYYTQNPDRTCHPLLPQLLACVHMTAEVFFIYAASDYFRKSRISKKYENNGNSGLQYPDSQP